MDVCVCLHDPMEQAGLPVFYRHSLADFNLVIHDHVDAEAGQVYWIKGKNSVRVFRDVMMREIRTSWPRSRSRVVKRLRKMTPAQVDALIQHYTGEPALLARIDANGGNPYLYQLATVALNTLKALHGHTHSQFMGDDRGEAHLRPMSYHIQQHLIYQLQFAMGNMEAAPSPLLACMPPPSPPVAKNAKPPLWQPCGDVIDRFSAFLARGLERAETEPTGIYVLF
jgi:hypothetical protein